MKKILIALMLCMVSITGFGQSWDYLGELKDKTSIREVKIDTTFIITHKVNDNTTMNEIKIDTAIYWHNIKFTDTDYLNEMIISYNNLTDNNLSYSFTGDSKDIVENIKCPTASVLKNYRIGSRCFKSGIAFSISGIFLAGIGGILIDYNRYTAGTTLLSIGTACVSVSIPLLCFGDHIKRECNMVVGK